MSRNFNTHKHQNDMSLADRFFIDCSKTVGILSLSSRQLHRLQRWPFIWRPCTACLGTRFRLAKYNRADLPCRCSVEICLTQGCHAMCRFIWTTNNTNTQNFPWFSSTFLFSRIDGTLTKLYTPKKRACLKLR